MRPVTHIVAVALLGIGLLANGTARAADTGSAPEAKAMLLRAVAAIKTDRDAALAEFSRGDNGFRDRDLYVFCARNDGKVDAHVDSTQIGRDLKDLYDVDGVAFGQEIIGVAKEGEIRAVSYMWPEPGAQAPRAKITFVTRVADQVCGVGYYK